MLFLMRTKTDLNCIMYDYQVVWYRQWRGDLWMLCLIQVMADPSCIMYDHQIGWYLHWRGDLWMVCLAWVKCLNIVVFCMNDVLCILTRNIIQFSNLLSWYKYPRQGNINEKIIAGTSTRLHQHIIDKHY